MSRPLLRLATGAASVFGFALAGHNWVAKIQQLEGEYSRSRLERLLALLPLAICVALFTIVMIALIRGYETYWSVEAMVAYAFPIVASVVMSYFVVRQLDVRYVFRRGEVCAYNTWGSLMWREPLAGLTRITCGRFGGNTSMTLRWRDHKRSLWLLDSLRHALDEQSGT